MFSSPSLSALELIPTIQRAMASRTWLVSSKGDRMSRRWVRMLPAAILASAFILAGCGEDDPSGPSDAPVLAGWVRSYGITAHAAGLSVKQTGDGGYIVTGYANGTNGDCVLLLKTDAAGINGWIKTFESPEWAVGKSVLQTADDGYLVLADYMGRTEEFWLIKTDPDGNMVWNQFKGYGDRNESPSQVQPTADGGYILIGSTDRGGHDHDFWLVKTGSGGETQWYTEKGYDDRDEFGHAIQQTSDGGYLMVGTTTVADGRIWLVKTFADGTTHWYKTVDTSGAAYGRALCKTSDGAYVVMGEVEQGSHQLIYLFKYDETGNELWRRPGDGSAWYWRGAVQQTTDGGFMVASSKSSDSSIAGDFCLIKCDGSGNTLWTKTYCTGICESGGQTADGGYVLCGNGGRNVILIKTDPDGNVD
jgi:hypothetical protein